MSQYNLKVLNEYYAPMDFEEFLTKHANELKCIFAENGRDREQDFDYIEEAYELYMLECDLQYNDKMM